MTAMWPSACCLRRVIEPLVTGPVGIEEYDVYVRPIEGGIIVPAIPDNDVGLLFSGTENRGIVDAGVDHEALVDVVASYSSLSSIVHLCVLKSS